MILNWLQTFKAGDPVRKVCSVRNMNRIANILNNIEGIGCRIVKNTTAEGRDWKIVVDGGTDVTPDQVPSGWPYRPGGSGASGYIEPFGIKSTASGDSCAYVEFYVSGLSGHATGMTQFKGVWYAVTDETSPGASGVELTASKAFYLSCTITASAGKQTAAFKFKMADTFPAGDGSSDPNKTIEIFPLWYIPIKHEGDGPYAIDEENIERWIGSPMIGGIS